MNPLLLSGIFDVGSKLIERWFPDPVKAEAAKLELFKLQQSGELAVLAKQTDIAVAQMAINAEEAKHPSVFVSGWRPGAGWVCVIALGYAAVVEPLARFGATMYGYTGVFPVIDTTITMQILAGMLGLVGARSWEKGREVAAK